MKSGSLPYLEYVQEAIATLGYVKPEFDAAMAIMLEANEGQHPKAIALEYRKIGAQLSKDRKRELGLRSNVFFSKEALESLTEKGVSNALEAHTTTLLRAIFSFYRERTVQQAIGVRNAYLKLESINTGCRGCDRLDGEKMQVDARIKLPPPDCDREACSIGVQLYIDHLADLD